MHLHGAIEAAAVSEADTSDAPASAHTTFAELLTTAYREHGELGELLGQFATSGATMLLYWQLEARIEFLHNRLATAIPCNDHGLNGTMAVHLTLGVWGSTHRIRRRLGQGAEDALPPGAVLQAISLCTSIITAMEIVRDTWFTLFGIEAVPVTAHSGFAGRFHTTVPR